MLWKSNYTRKVNNSKPVKIIKMMMRTTDLVSGDLLLFYLFNLADSLPFSCTLMLEKNLLPDIVIFF